MKTRPAILAAALGAAMLSAATLAVPAAAAETQGRTSVRYSDLDLGTDAGKAELSKRFDQAARDICGVKGTEAAPGRERYCYQKTSKQLAQRVEAILQQHQEALGG